MNRSNHLRLVKSTDQAEEGNEPVEKAVKVSEIEIRGDAFTASGIARYKKQQKDKGLYAD
ncbi:hypothetical protein [Nitrosomonas sp. Nm34]|uniref:hypothetical protein n=1 Tax=Nitrosomonas sp. Nm34 TaxID=1881055 RepID=UPI0008E39347|nr:hypothetical protein [Nitrosomonas sp. Nm34]SFI75940.1 hypothetical protein SAMN05428978_10336 [Nitrosomonas sp. Nm34]